jgi:NADH-quinone oxidoreductase subunit H
MAVVSYLVNNAVSMAPVAADWPGGYWWHWLFFTAVIIVFVLTMMMGATWIERRGMGRMQSRLGPNRTGPFGLLQVAATAVKILLKENIVPTGADKIIHLLAPIVAFTPVLLMMAVVPFQDGALLADLNIGILYFVAVGSISMIGVFMAGWASGNKYSLLGAMRAVASTVSYEIPLVLSILGVVLVAGSLSLNDIVNAQDIPFVLLQPLGFIIFFTAASAEINRSPFDLTEADSELTAGFHTEYSGMRFGMFYLAEYAEAMVMSAIIAILFFSGWRGPWLPPWLWFIGKTIIIFFVMVWVRTTLPRVRIDQLMGFAWKFLLPLALINLFVTAIQVLVWPDALPWAAIIINFAIAIVLIIVWSRFFKVGRSKIEA